MAEINYYADHIIQGTLSTSGATTLGGTLTVQNGNISLGSGTGRIQGVDTVSASTDAANKAYVDAHPDGTVTSVGLTSQGDAIAIIGTPVTTSGNLGITFQGDTSDYINGEGDLEAFPNIPQGTITGGGVSSRVAFWSGTSSLSSDANLYWDGTNDRLGVGTSTPSVPLHVVGTLRAGGSSDYIELRDNGNIMLADSNCAIAPIYTGSPNNTLNIGFTMTGIWQTINHYVNEVVWNPGALGNMDGMNLSSAGDLLIKGDVGIGTTAPLEKLQVDGNVAIYGEIKGYTGSSSNQYLSILQSSSLTYISTGTTNETIYFGIGPVANTTNINCTGTATATNFILSSDERLKKNIKDLKPKKLDVKWKSFELKLEPDYKRVGVIAQELEKTNPEFVREDVDGTKSVAYIDLLITKIVELEARLEKAGL
jgi:hypothetical protein